MLRLQASLYHFIGFDLLEYHYPPFLLPSISRRISLCGLPQIAQDLLDFFQEQRWIWDTN